MTNEQMAELAARLRSAAGFFDGCLRDDLYSLVPHLNCAADLIAGMAQRAPLTEQQIRESFEHTVRALNLPLDRRGDGYRSTYTNIAWRVAFGTVNRLHRSMAQRVPLSTEQIHALVQPMDWPPSVTEIIRAVESAHGIRSEK